MGTVWDRGVLLFQAEKAMKYEFTESHFVLEFEGKARVRMTLDEADRLRTIIEQHLYRKAKAFDKVKEGQHANLVRSQAR